MWRDWFVWPLALMLFASGAVWAQVDVPIKFFAVTDLKSLLEIFASLATVAAVVLAYRGLSIWKEQIRGSSDNEIAMRVLLASRRYKDASHEAWSDARFSIIQFERGRSSLPDTVWKYSINKMEASIADRKIIRDEFKGELHTVRALWGVEFSKEYDDILSFESDCTACVELLIRYIRNYPVGLALLHPVGDFAEFKRRLERRGMFDIEGESSSKVDALCLEADQLIRSRMA